MKIFLLFVALSSLFHAALSSKIAQQPENGSNDCQVCLYVMKFIRYQTTQQDLPLSAVKEKLSELYKILPKNIKNEEFMTNLGVFVSMIKEGKDPGTICKFLGKCTTVNPKIPMITECQVCTAIVDLIKFELVISNATIQVIIKAVEALCAILGDVPVYEECKLILGEINKIIQWIEQQVTPTDICIRLGLCPKKTRMVASRHVKMWTCQIVVHNLRTQSQKGWSEDKMKGKITDICKTLELNRFHCYHIQANLKTILALIKKGQGAEEVCGNRMVPNKHVVLRKNQPTNLCDFCMMIMKAVDTQLGELDKDLVAIETKLNQLCSELEDLAQECQYVVDLVIGNLEKSVKYAESELDPTKACKALKLCPKLMVH